MTNIIFDNNTPIYIQIIDLFKKNIISGKYQKGDKLPSVRQLSSELKVNPNTIQRAYQELERVGLTYTKRGMGSFATENEEVICELKNKMANKTIENFLTEMLKLGFKENQVYELITERLKGGKKDGNNVTN